MLRNQNFKSLLLTAILFSFLWPWLCWAQGMPTLETIFQKVVESTEPAQSYRVDVVQTVSSLLSEQTEPPKIYFTVFFDPQKGFSTKEISGPGSGDPSGSSRVRVTVDSVRLLRDLLSWPGVDISVDHIQGRNYYRISGNAASPDLSCLLWVDAERWYVSRSIIRLRGRIFFDTTIDYRRVGEQYWLPGKISMRRDSDGLQILQEFGTHIFNPSGDMSPKEY